MKLIVDISEGILKNIDSIQNGSIGSKQIINKVKNGIPLDDVLNKIRAEIKHYNLRQSNYPCDMISIGTVLQIIDKYREGESE